MGDKDCPHPSPLPTGEGTGKSEALLLGKLPCTQISDERDVLQRDPPKSPRLCTQ